MQYDLFEEALSKKIVRLEKWIHRLHKEMVFLKGVYELHQARKKIPLIQAAESQIDIFSA